MVIKIFRLLIRSILISKLGVSLKLRFRAHMGGKQTQKFDCKEFSFWAHEPLKNWEKKHVRLWNHLILMSEIGVRLKLRCWAKMSNRHEKSDFNEFRFWAHEPLKMGKQTFQAFKSHNFEVRASSESQITILSKDEKDTDAKNWATRNSASEIKYPLEMVKKNMTGCGIAKCWCQR